MSRSPPRLPDRKSTRLNSSHVKISYAVFCLKKETRSRQVGVPPQAGSLVKAGPTNLAEVIPRLRTYFATRASSISFFFNDTATTEIYTLSLHDALPISANSVADDCPGPDGVVQYGLGRR